MSAAFYMEFTIKVQHNQMIWIQNPNQRRILFFFCCCFRLLCLNDKDFRVKSFQQYGNGMGAKMGKHLHSFTKSIVRLLSFKCFSNNNNNGNVSLKTISQLLRESMLIFSLTLSFLVGFWFDFTCNRIKSIGTIEIANWKMAHACPNVYLWRPHLAVVAAQVWCTDEKKTHKLKPEISKKSRLHSSD